MECKCIQEKVKSPPMVGVIATPPYTIFMVKILAEFSAGGVKADVQKNKISVKLFS